MRTCHAHPAAERLHLFGRGRLPDAEAAEVAEHVSACAACAGELDRLPPDPFLAALRGARGATDAPTPCHDDRVTLFGPDGGHESGPLPPELLSHARYRVGALLGRGGMGAVYKAEHALMERPVALKVIAPRLLEHAGAAERFRQEVKAAARLQHPHIVTAFDAEQVGPVTVLVMEFVDGRSLSEVLREGGPLPVAAACDYARQAALGLAHAHEQGMAHRDVKPHNLMLTAEGRVKILDFGLARFVSDEAADALVPVGIPLPASLTQTGVCMGTPDYMAPEQAVDSRAADARSDVYALGATLYHLLAGRVPFEGGTAYEKLARLATTDPTPLPAVRPDLPPGLVAVVGKMMAKQPADRFRTATEAAAALAPFTTTARPRRRRILLSAAILALLATLAAGVVKVATDRGEVTIQTDDPDVEVVVKGERIVRIRDPKTGREYALDRTDLTLYQTDGDGLHVKLDGTQSVVLRRKGEAIATVRLTVPAKAAAAGPPFVPFRGHTDLCRGAAFAPDGNTLYTGSDDGTARAWDAATGRELRRFDHRDVIRGVAVAEGGRTLLTAGESDLRAWNTATGQALGAFPAVPRGEVLNGVAVSPDGKLAATVSLNGTVRVWDVAARTAVRDWKTGGGREVFVVAWSPDGRAVATGGHDGAVTLSDPTAGKAVSRFVMPSGSVSSLAFSADGAQVHVGLHSLGMRTLDRASGAVSPLVAAGREEAVRVAVASGGRVVVGQGRRVEVLDPASGQFLENVTRAPAPIAWVAVSPDGRRAVAVDFGGAVTFAALKPTAATPAARDGGGEVRRFEGHVGPVGTADIAPDGRRAVSGGADGTARLWDVATGKELARFGEPTGRIRGVAFSRDGKRVLVCGLQVVFLWDLESNKATHRFPHTAFVHSAALSPDGKVVLTGDGDSRTGVVRVWDVGTGREVRRMSGHAAAVSALAVSPDGRRALSASHDRTVRLWDVETAREIHSLAGHTGWVEAAAFSPDGRRAISAGRDRAARVWDLDTGKEVYAFQSPTEWLGSAAFLPDGGHALVGGGEVGGLWVLDVTGRKATSQLRNWAGVVWSLTPLPDGRQILSANGDGTVRLFRLPGDNAPLPSVGPLAPALPGAAARLSETRRHPLPGPNGGVHTYTAAFAPDGSVYAVGGDDGHIRVWDARTGELRQTPTGGTAHLRFAFSPDGKRLLASVGKSVRLWNVGTGRPLNEWVAPADVYTTDVSPDGARAAFACADGTVRLWDVGEWREVRCHKVVGVTGAVFAAGGRELLAWSGGKSLRRMVADTGEQLAAAECAADTPAVCTLAADGKRFVAVSLKGVSVRDAVTLKEIPTPAAVPDFGGIVHSGVSPDGRLLVYAPERDRTVRVWDIEKGIELDRLTLPARLSGHFAFSPDGQFVACGGYRGCCFLLRLGSLHPALAPPLAPPPPAPPAPTGPTIPRVSAVTRFPVFHPDGRHLLTPDGNDVTVWDARTRAKVKTFTGLADRVMAVRLTAGGNTVVALSSGKRVMGWDWATGKTAGEFHAPAMPEPIALCVFPDGKRVAVPAEPGFVSVRELPAGKEVARIDLNDPTEWVCTLAPSPDGRWLAVVGKQGRTHLWDTTVGKVAAVLPGVPLSMNHAVGGFSPDGKYLGVGASAALRVWRVGEWAAPTVTPTDASGLVAFDETGAVTTAPVQPFNRTVAACRWDAASGAAVGRVEFALGQAWNHCGLSPDGRTLAVDVEARRAFVLTPLPARPPVAPMPRIKP